jgi:MFS family permease
MADRTAARMPWLIIIAGSLITMLIFGPRSAMGLFQLPMLQDRGWDRSTFGLAIALQNLLWGVSQPFFGAMADRYGTGRVLAIAGLLYGAGMIVMAHAAAPIWLHVGGGILIGLAIGAGSLGTILSAFARHVTPEQRSFAFGIGSAASSAGMFLFSPLSVELINHFGWSDALVIMGVMMFIVPLLAFPLRGNSQSGRAGAPTYDQTAMEALREAFGHASYVLLVAGFFVCGYQLAFITAHFPAYLGDIGIDVRYAGISIALIGLFNVFGSLIVGALGERYPKRYILASIYIARSVAVTAFILLPKTPVTVVVFAAVMGLLWLSTVPPTNGLVAVMFGTRHLGLLGGMVFLSHQIGSFLGVWMGGRLRDTMGSYDVVWWTGVILGIFAAIVHWPIRERLVDRPAVAAE